MTEPISSLDPTPNRELRLIRVIPAPPARVYRAWTEELGRWWGPHGMTTPFVEMDLRVGGGFRTIMRAPDGTEYPTRAVFLEVVPHRRIVFTDAFTPGWLPQENPFFTAIISFDAAEAGQTRLTARALHWTVANRERHEQLGFHAGWGESFDRLAALVTHH